ncbi:MAG: hypothetical protein Q9174_006820 [Haloplaca sp. 1 TL-2023]
MVHAYYLQRCGHRDRGFNGTGYDLGHDQSFVALLKFVGEYLRPLREYVSPELEDPRKYYGGHGNDKHSLVHSVDPTSGVSCCYGIGTSFNDRDIQSWRDNAVATAASLQESRKSNGGDSSNAGRDYPRTVFWMDKDGKESPPMALDSSQAREGYIFLRCEDRCYPVARSKITDLANLTASPLFKDRMYLQLPQGTSDADFQMFYLFLVHGVYPTSLKQLNDRFDHNPQGAPIIVHTSTSGVPSLFPLLTAYKLASTIKYKPFCEHVLKGLRGLHATADDPTTILEKVYPSLQQSSQNSWPVINEVKPADAQLRVWIKIWLVVIRDPSGRYEATYGSNLAILKNASEFEDKFARLCERSEELKQDVKAAETELSRRRGGNSPMPSSLTPTVAQFFQNVPRGLDIFEPQFPPQGSNSVPYWINDKCNVNPYSGLNLNSQHQYLDTMDLANLRNALPQAFNPTQPGGVVPPPAWQQPLQPRAQHFHPYPDLRSQAERGNGRTMPHDSQTEVKYELWKELMEFSRQQDLKDRKVGQ